MKTSSAQKPRYFLSAVVVDDLRPALPNFEGLSNATPKRKKEPNGLSSVHQFPETLTCAAKLGPPNRKKEKQKISNPSRFLPYLGRRAASF